MLLSEHARRWLVEARDYEQRYRLIPENMDLIAALEIAGILVLAECEYDVTGSAYDPNLGVVVNDLCLLYKLTPSGVNVVLQESKMSGQINSLDRTNR